MLKHLQNANEFEKEVQGEAVLVDFFAEWCGPCQMLAPVLEQFAKESEVKVIKIDVDEVPELARQFRVMSIPTLMLFKDGQMVKQMVGLQSKEELKKQIDALL